MSVNSNSILATERVFAVASSHKIRLARAVVDILRPLIQLLIRHEFTHSELNDLIRQTYVEVAYDKYKLPDQDMNVSRVAVLTGLSRKEVVRMRDGLGKSEARLRQKPNRAQRVVHGWLNDSEFLDKKNNPIDLPIKNQRAGKEYASFVALVKRYSGDITYGVVLDELNYIGVTDQPDEKTVRLVNSAYVPRKDELEQVRVIAASVSDLFKTTVHNIDADESDMRFQRQVIYTDVNEEFVDEFRKLSSEKAAPLIEQLNKKLAKSREKSEKKPSAVQKRLGFGLYYFEEPSPEPEEDLED